MNKHRLFQVDGEISSYARRNWQTAPPKATTTNYSFKLEPLLNKHRSNVQDDRSAQYMRGPS